MPYIGVSPQFGVRRKHTYTATAGQTSFSGAGSEGATLSYTDSNFVDVYQNGVKLGDADYTSTSGTAIVLAQGASVDDLVEIIVFDAFSAADTVSKADGGTFDGNVTMAGTLGVTGNQTNSGNLTVSGAFTSQGIDDNADAIAVTIDSDENVCIGVTSKNSANNGSLTIGHTGMTKISASASGNADELVLIGANASANVGMSIIANNANDSTIFLGDEDDTDIGGLIYTHSNNSFFIKTNGSNRFRVDSNGGVGISDDGSPPSGVAFFNVVRNSGEIAYFQNYAGVGATLSAGNNSFSTVSDQTKKENIVELNKEQSYNNIKNIRAVTYNYKDVIKDNEDGTTTTYEDDKSRIGFIAQDWETKYSQLVNTDDDGVKSLLYTETTPVLLSALQKAQEKIEALEARITALENEE